MIRILHTSDWHLGHSFGAVSREHEHRVFLDWLLGVLEERRVDALLVAGDVFDTSNPSARAQALWYAFVAEARRRLPRLRVVVIAGNHDSAGRLEAPGPLFDAFGVHAVGTLGGDGGFERVVVPLENAEGEVEAWALAVPFLRPADLPPGAGSPEEGVAEVYRRAVEAAAERRAPGQGLVALGHAYVRGGTVSEWSEHRILGGNQHALPLETFPEEIAYVALGHLHRPQAPGGQERVRYSGAPLPLDVSEAGYPSQVVLVELEGDRLLGTEALRAPRPVEILRVPGDGAAPLDEVLDRLRALDPLDGEPADPFRPYLEVRVRLDRPDPGLRARVDEALEGRAARLLRLSVEYTGTGEALAEAAPSRTLEEITPEDVFRAAWARSFEADPPAEMLAAFHELVDRVRHGEGAA
ncbi:exonuclease SbcCD subunit D C-terminal domain-containing protein [Deferrisoma palaeochoriense]